MKYILVLLTLVISLQAHLENKSFTHDGIERSYLVYAPPNFQPNSPVVLTLTGYGASVEFLMNHTKMNEVSDTAGFLVVYPRPVNDRWNSGISDNPDRPTPNVDDVDFLATLIDTLVSDYGVDPNYAYTTGWSNGGYMSFRLVGERPSKFTKMASVTGTLTNTIVNACSSYIPMPIFMLFGTADPLVTYPGDAHRFGAEETLEFWLSKNGCSTKADTFMLPDLDPNDMCTIQIITFDDCSSGQEVIFCKVLNGGHPWPGSGFGYTSTYGPVNEDVDGSDLIWSFFNDMLSKYIGSTVHLDDPLRPPIKLKLSQNYPNPFNPITTISYDLRQQSDVSLTVYDMKGQEIKTLQHTEKQAGHYEVQWNGVDESGNPVSTGIYFARLQAGDYSKTIKMVYLK